MLQAWMEVEFKYILNTHLNVSNIQHPCFRDTGDQKFLCKLGHFYLCDHPSNVHFDFFIYIYLLFVKHIPQGSVETRSSFIGRRARSKRRLFLDHVLTLHPTAVLTAEPPVWLTEQPRGASACATVFLCHELKWGWGEWDQQPKWVLSYEAGLWAEPHLGNQCVLLLWLSGDTRGRMMANLNEGERWGVEI